MALKKTSLLMKKRHLLPVVAASLILSGASGLVHAQTQSFSGQSAFFGAPTPSDFPSDTGETPVGEDNAGVDPLGFIAGSPIDFTFAIREGYDDNLFTTRTDTDSSFYTNFAAGMAYEFGSPRLQLTSSLGGGATYYYTRPGDKMDFNGQFSLNATYLATPKLTIAIGTTTAYLSQPDTNIIGGTNRVDGDYIYTNTNIDGTYQWTEKFSTVTGYQFYGNYYMESSLNDTQSFISQTIRQNARWLLLPKTTILLEYRANPITYVGGAGLNSFGNFALFGVDQIFNPRFKWTARLGVEQRFNQNPIDGDSTYLGPYGESNLSYQFGPSSTLSWNARYGTEPSGLTNVTQRQTFRTGLAVNHGFTQRISANLGFNFQYDYYDQANVIDPFYQALFDVSAGIAFKVNRHVSINAGYQFVTVYAPENIAFEYTRNVCFVGANFGF